MRHFSTSVTIEAPPARVWQAMADVARWAEWTASVRRVERLDAGPLAVGSRVRIEQPKLGQAVWTVTEWEPGSRFTWVSRSPGFVATAQHAVESSAGGSRVTLTVDLAGFLAPVVGLLLGGLTRRYMGLEAAGLKSRCEGIGVLRS